MADVLRKNLSLERRQPSKRLRSARLLIVSLVIGKGRTGAALLHNLADKAVKAKEDVKGFESFPFLWRSLR